MADPYCYPATEVLINKLDIRDPDELKRQEHDLVLVRSEQLRAKPVKGEYDLDHLRAVHRHLFQDLYSWAGELRTVDIAKGSSFAPAQFLEAGARDVFRQVRTSREQLAEPDVEPEDAAKHLADALGEINALHPFREGNGRAQRELISQLAAEAGWQIEWDQIDPQRNLDASVQSFRGDAEPLREMLAEVIHPADREQPSRAQLLLEWMHSESLEDGQDLVVLLRDPAQHARLPEGFTPEEAKALQPAVDELLHAENAAAPAAQQQPTHVPKQGPTYS